MWQQLSKTKRILIAISLLMFATIALMVSITYTYFAKITTASLNQLLSPYHTQITHLSITPNALFQGKVGAITLDVDGNIIHIDKLQVALRDEIVWRSPSLNDIKSIAVDNVEVSLSPTVFTQLTKNTDNKDPQSFSMQLKQLPLIAIGKARLNFAEIENEQLHLELNYLSLDQQGRLFSALSLQNKPLFKINAELKPEQWQAQTQLSLDSLNDFVTTLIELKREQLQQANLTSATLKHGQTDLQKALPQMASLSQIINRFKPSWGGTIASNINLDLANHQLNSTHQWLEPFVSISRIETKSLTYPIKLAPKQPLTLSLSGAFDALQLDIEPMQLDLSLTPEQQRSLLDNTIKDEALTLDIIQVMQAFSSLKPTTKSQELIANLDLNFQLPQQTSYQLTNQQLSLPELQFAIALTSTQHSNKLAGGLTNLLFHPQMETKTNATTNKYGLTSQWQLDVNLGSPFCVSQQDSALSFNQKCDDNTKMQISYQQLNLLLSGTLQLTSAADTLTSRLSLDPQSQLIVDAPRFVLHDLHLTAKQIATEILSESILNNLNQLDLGQTQLTVKGNKLQLIATDNLNAQALNIASQMTQLQLTGATIDIGDVNSLKLNLAPFTAKTLAPILTLDKSGKDKIAQPLMQLTSDQFALTSNEDFQLQRDKTAAVNNTDLTNIKGIIPPLSLHLDGSQLIQYFTDNNKLTTNIAAIELYSTGILNSDKTADKQPIALFSQAWQTQLWFNLSDLKQSESYFRLGKQRVRQHIQFNKFKIEQQLKWQPKINKAELQSFANWSLDDIHFTSQHKLAVNHPILTPINQEKTSVQVTGSLDFNSDINLLINQLKQNFKLTMPLNAIGDVSVNIDHQFLWTPNKQQITAQITPTIDITEGDINQLPFEQVSLLGQCLFELQHSSNKQADHFYCPDLALSIQAFNPGVLLTHIVGNAHIDMENTLVGTTTARKTNKQAADIDFTATADILGGKLLLPQFDFNLNAPSHAYLILQGLALQQLMQVQPQVGVYADGIFDGVLPVTLNDGKVSVSGGTLAARPPGGLIKVDDNPAVTQMRLSQPYLDFAFSLLEELHYSELASSFDMDNNGDAILSVNIKGRAKEVERPIHLNYNQEENLLQLLKSLQIGDTLQSQIENAMGQ